MTAPRITDEVAAAAVDIILKPLGTSLRRPTLLESFSAKYLAEPTSGCWLWEAAIDGRYGEIQHQGRRVKAHRVSWMLHRGAIPDGLSVLHHCDNTFCVNPDHLFLGTRTDNMRDCSAKGRNAMQRRPSHSSFAKPGLIQRPQGEKHGMVVLNENQVRAIRSMARGGTCHREIAESFGVSRGHVSGIVKGKTWRHILADAIRGDQ